MKSAHRQAESTARRLVQRQIRLPLMGGSPSFGDCESYAAEGSQLLGSSRSLESDQCRIVNDNDLVLPRKPVESRGSRSYNSLDRGLFIESRDNT